MRINCVGATTGHHQKLAQYLWSRHIPNHIDGQPLNTYDITFVQGINSLTADMFNEGNPPVVGWAMGADVLGGISGNRKKLLEQCALVLYSQKRAEKITGVKGVPWNIPYDHTIFHKHYLSPKEEDMRDTLIYCRVHHKYRAQDALNYIYGHPDEKFTVLGGGMTLLVKPPDNLEIVRWTHNLPYLMNHHRKLMFWITEQQRPDRPLINVIGCEALAMGLKVYVNNKQHRYLPNYMKRKVAMPRLIKMFQRLLK